MVRLTREEQSMLAGEQGRLKQVALENVVRYAEILGAERLCRVTKATVFCGAHSYLKVCDSPDFHEVFSRLSLGCDERIAFDRIDPGCYAQSCVAPCDQFVYEPLHQTKALFDKNSAYLEECRKAGVTIAGTCSPYLTGWIPVKGEHFVTTESSMTILGNSLWGACCNADGIEAAFWSSICGRTPEWGFHVAESRHGTHLFRVEADLSAEQSWEVLGAAIGKKLPPTGGVPVLVGDFAGVDFVKLKLFMVSLSCTSNCRMCHIVGVTPEAPTLEAAFAGHLAEGEFVMTDEDLTAVYCRACEERPGKVELVSLGCPHYDIHQIRQVAEYIKGKKVHPDVLFMVWTVYPIKAMADLNGYTKIIEEAGGHIFTSSCPTTIGSDLLSQHDGQAYDSYKQKNSCLSSVEAGARMYYTDKYRCIDAAVAGEWKEAFRWRRSC